MQLHVLLIDDDADDLTLIRSRLRATRPRFQALALTVARTWKAAKVRIVLEAFDVIVVSSRTPDATAVEMLEALRGLPHPPVIVLTPDDDLDTAMQLLRAGADDCVMQHLRDWTVELHLAIERLTASAQRRGDLADTKAGFDEYAAVLAALLLRRQTPWVRSAMIPAAAVA